MQMLATENGEQATIGLKPLQGLKHTTGSGNRSADRGDDRAETLTGIETFNKGLDLHTTTGDDRAETLTGIETRSGNFLQWTALERRSG